VVAAHRDHAVGGPDQRVGAGEDPDHAQVVAPGGGGLEGPDALGSHERPGDDDGTKRNAAIVLVCGEHPVEQRPLAADRRVLLQQNHIRPRNDRPPALVRVDHRGEALQERRLARAVAADQRQAIAFADVKIEAAEQPAFALNEAQIFIGEQRRSHGRALTEGLTQLNPSVANAPHVGS